MKVRPNVRRKSKRMKPHQRLEQRLRAAVKAILTGRKLWYRFRYDCSATERQGVIATLLDSSCAQPRVVLTAAAERTVHADDVIREITDAMNAVARASVPTVSPEEWWAWYPRCLLLMEKVVGGRSAPTRVAPTQGDPLAAVIRERDALFDLLRGLQRRVWMETLASRSRIESGLFLLRPDLAERGAVEVDYVPAQVRYFTLDGRTRRAYRSGLPLVIRSGITASVWHDWPASVIPGGAGRALYPVYVQGHALHRLEQRLDFPEANTAFRLNLGASLREPVLSPGRRAGEYLVEFRMNGRLFGYLVARLVGNEVLVRSFLFLTMSGTPEGEKVRQRLRLRGRDLDYTRLDRWSTFALTDLGADAELVEMFGACGCGQLFEPRDDLVDVEPDVKAADELRRYLGMPPRKREPPSQVYHRKGVAAD